MAGKSIFDWVDGTDTKSRVLAVEHLCDLYNQDVLDVEQKRASEAVMMILMDDQSPKVRQKLAQSICFSETVPSLLINTLVRDQVDVSGPLLACSPAIKDNTLVDIVAEGCLKKQLLISQRLGLSVSVSAALIEVGEVDAILSLMRNASATIAKVSLTRLSERLGTVGPIRQMLLERRDIPSDVRHKLVEDLGSVFAKDSFISNIIGRGRANYIAKDACTNATLTLIDNASVSDHSAIVSHLCTSGKLTPSLLISALCVGSVDFFAAAIGFLANSSPDRIKTILNDGHQTLVANLYKKAGLQANIAHIFVRATFLWRENSSKQNKLYSTDRVATQLCDEFSEYLHDDQEIAEILMLVENIRIKKNRELVKDFALNLTQKAA